ncbi:YhbY family RNA-binding protein [Acidithiobacillus thiooxidans]|uniref:YhbY family RNA-binding protein n=1 Tax=Acidithiobacillus thiooxidans TaxID=930 RepID=UPI00026249D9|nr:YhbY family RNA-binding protein [Acidithiobacillus thiooxidans]MBU2811897.1 YhbY family RNA-binding protein [Acidithiobacillus thiooxidans]
MLDAKQRQNLRGQAHTLKPVVMIGAQGVTDALLAELEIALDAHELIKVRLPQVEHALRDAMITRLVSASHAEIVGRIGRIAILYRPRPAAKTPNKRR